MKFSAFSTAEGGFQGVEGGKGGCGRRKKVTESGAMGGKWTRKKNSPELLAYRFRTVWEMGENVFANCDNLVAVCDKGSYVADYCEKNGVQYKIKQ